MADQITELELELSALKRQREEEKTKAKVQSTWVSVKKRLPYNDTIRVVVWANGQMVRCWHKDSNWYAFDGTWFFTQKDRVEGVTHWLARDWMEAKEWPLYGPGITNRLRYYWSRVTGVTQGMAYDLRTGGWGKKAQLSRKPVFYRDSIGRLMTGMPENLPTPYGFEKITCGSALEAERYSSLQRQQERGEHSRVMAERAEIEGRAQAQIRSERRTLIANARNSMNRDFLIAANERFDKQAKPWEYQRESYLHSEAHEDGH